MRSISLGRAASFALLGITLLVPGRVFAAGSEAVVTVSPEQTDEILTNPGMGWQTFHHTASEDRNLPSWIPSTVHYARWECRWRGFQKVFRSDVTVDRWLPGSIPLFTDEFFTQPGDLPPGKIHDVADTIHIPENMSPGEYVLSIGVVDVNAEEPVVQLGIQGRAKDGWYPLSQVRIGK